MSEAQLQARGRELSDGRLTWPPSTSLRGLQERGELVGMRSIQQVSAHLAPKALAGRVGTPGTPASLETPVPKVIQGRVELPDRREKLAPKATKDQPER